MSSLGHPPALLDAISLPDALLHRFPWLPVVATLIAAAVAVVIIARILRRR